MAKKLQKKSLKGDLFDSLKRKAIDLGVDYVKKNFSFTADDVAKHVERYLRRKIERRVRYELRKQVYRYLVLFFLFLGIGFLTYFLFDLAVFILEMPDFMTSFFLVCF